MEENEVKSCLEHCGKSCIDPDIIHKAKEILKESNNNVDESYIIKCNTITYTRIN